MNSSYSDFKQTHNYSQIDNDSSKTSVECKRVGPIYLIGYLGSAILTKGKTGLGCLQQPLHDLYMSFRCNSSKLFQERRLIISTDGLSLLYNEAGIEKIISNDLSSVNDIQLLRIDCEQRRDKKTYSAFLPFGEEITDNRYQNLYFPIDKNHSQTIESLAHPPVIALVMRRATGIQALECHVFIARSTAEAKSIVMSIRNVCCKYKYDQSQATQVFQYTPFADEQNLDLITNLNTTSNSHSTLTKTKRHHILDKENNKANASSVFSKSETNLNSKNNNNSNSTTLFNKLTTRTRSKSKSSAVPPLPAKKPQVKSKQKDTSEKRDSKRRFNKFLNKSFSSSSSTNENIEKQLHTKSSSTINLAQPSQTSILSTNQQVIKTSQSQIDSTNNSNKKDKKPSIGKRLFSSINSKSTKNLSSKSTTSISTVNKSSKDKQNEQQHLGDIDFRKSRTSIIDDDNLLIDGSNIYPIATTKLPSKTQQQQQQQQQLDSSHNFILKSRNSPLVDECSRPSHGHMSHAKSTNYLSSSSLIQNHNDRRTGSYHSQQQFQQPVRAQSIASIYRPESPRIDYTTDNMAKKYSHEYEKNASQSRLSRRPNEYFSEIEINGSSRLRSPIQQQKLLSNHLVWNKNSKSAESLDKKLSSSSSNIFRNSRHNSRNASRLDSESIIARAISPGIHLMQNEPTRSRSSYVTSDFRQTNDSYKQDLQYNLIKENKLANINQIINSNINNNQASSLSYKPISNNNHTRNYSPISNEFRPNAQKTPSKYTSYVSIGADRKPTDKSEYNLDLNDYNRINKAYNQTSSSDFYSIANAKSEYDFDSASKVTGRYDMSGFDTPSDLNSNKHNKIVGGIKVLPHFTYHDNEYNLIDNSDKVFKHQQGNINVNKLSQYTTSMSIDNDRLDHEVIDLTKRNNKLANNNNAIEIPIYLSTCNSNESPSEYHTHMHTQTSTKFVNIEPYDKPRMVSTAFITPIIPDDRMNHSGRNSPLYQMSVQKPRCIYYYDDESFGGY